MKDNFELGHGYEWTDKLAIIQNLLELTMFDMRDFQEIMTLKIYIIYSKAKHFIINAEQLYIFNRPYNKTNFCYLIFFYKREDIYVNISLAFKNKGDHDLKRISSPLFKFKYY